MPAVITPKRRRRRRRGKRRRRAVKIKDIYIKLSKFRIQEIILKKIIIKKH